MAIGVDRTVIHQNIIAAQNPGATRKVACRNLHQVHFHIVLNIIIEELCMLTSDNHSKLAASEGKGLIIRHCTGAHTAGSTPHGTLVQVGGGCAADILTCTGNGVLTGIGVDGNTIFAGFYIVALDLEEVSLTVQNDHQTSFYFGHTANNNLTVVIETDAMLSCKRTLADDDAVIYIRLHIGAATKIEIVAIGSIHDLSTGLLLIILSQIHNGGQGGFVAITIAVDHPLVFRIFCGGVILTIEDLLRTAFADGLLVVGKSVLLQFISRIL